MVFVSAGRRGYGCRARRSSRPRALRCSRTSCSECDRTARSYRGTGLTSCLAGRFTQRVNLRMSRSEAVRLVILLFHTSIIDLRVLVLGQVALGVSRWAGALEDPNRQPHRSVEINRWVRHLLICLPTY